MTSPENTFNLDFFASQLPDIEKEPELIHFTVCGEAFTLNPKYLPDVPHLQTLVSTRLPVNTDSSGALTLDSGPDGSIKPADVRLILRYAESHEPRHLFAKLPSGSGTDALRLVRLWDYLCAPSPDLSLASLHERLTAVKNFLPLDDVRDEARNAAVDLVLGLVRKEYDVEEVSIRNNLFNKVRFVVSHPATFKRRMRRHVYNAFTSSVRWSRKQIAQLDTWLKNTSWSDGSDSCSDSTSEDEVKSYYDSDDDFWGDCCS